MKTKRIDGQDYALVKITSISYCQSCGKDFENEEILHYVPIDNNLVCLKCSSTFTADKELRIYLAD